MKGEITMKMQAKQNSLYTEIDVSRAYKNGQPVKHSLLEASKDGQNNTLRIKNLNRDILEVKFADSIEAMFHFVKPGESREIPENNDSKNHKIYVRLIKKS